jgi:hypothetical protein
MHTIARLTLTLGLALASVLFAAPGEATTLAHTWVASTGSDGANCDRPTPCATFQGAYNNTAAGGEITCVDSGDFDGVTISESITTNCENTIASNGTEGSAFYATFSIITGASDTVILKGLDVDGLADGCNGSALILFHGAGTLHLQNVKVNHLLGSCSGVYFGATGAATLDVSNSDITDNGNSSTAAGIDIQPSSGVQAKISIENSRINNNNFGIIADGTLGGIIKGTITDSVVSGNSQNGITVSGSGSSAVFQVDRTTVGGNGNHGLAAAGSGSGMLVSNTNVFNNGGGLFTETGGALFSYGNNHVNGNNGADGTFSGTVGQQ